MGLLLPSSSWLLKLPNIFGVLELFVIQTYQELGFIFEFERVLRLSYVEFRCAENVDYFIKSILFLV